MSFTEDEVEQCMLLQHRIYALFKQHSNQVAFAVMMTILIKSIANEHNKKEDFMDAVSQSWDSHMGNKEHNE